MVIHVYDTYVTAGDQHVMHFDVFTAEKDHQQAIAYAKEWLATIGEGDASVTAKECQFCHSQQAPESVIDSINEKGYFIYQMEGCPG